MCSPQLVKRRRAPASMSCSRTRSVTTRSSSTPVRSRHTVSIPGRPRTSRRRRGSRPGSTGAAECKTFAQYMVANYAQPKTRLSQVTIRPVRPDDPRAADIWDLLCNVDISDKVNVDMNFPGLGGVTQAFFVEGITERWEPLKGSRHRLSDGGDDVGSVPGRLLDDAAVSRAIPPVHASDHRRGGPDPFPVRAVLHIKVTSDDDPDALPVAAGTNKFVFAVAEDMAGLILRRVEAFVSTTSSSGRVQVQVGTSPRPSTCSRRPSRSTRASCPRRPPRSWVWRAPPSRTNRVTWSRSMCSRRARGRRGSV